MPKTFILDSSVFLASPHALDAFGSSDVIILPSVISDLSKAAKGRGDFSANAIEFLRILDGLFEGEDGTMANRPERGHVCISDAENTIFEHAMRYQATIVSRDPAVRLQARARGIAAEPFKAERTPEDSGTYMGRCYLYVSPEEMGSFAREGKLILHGKHYGGNPMSDDVSEDYALTVNEYVTLINSAQNSSTMLGRFDGHQIVPLRFYRKDQPVYGVTARNAAQMFALDALMDPDAPLVILQGPAGTAKTFLSMAAALQQTLDDNRYRRILVTRPNTKMDNDVGFLKGDERDKVLPTIRGLLDNVDNLMPNAVHSKDGAAGSPLDDLMERGVIEAQAMAYMRGRSITRQFMIVDEMQNATPTQALSIITRIGEQSKIVLLGDPDQIDSPYLDKKSNGLVYAAEGMRGSALCWQLTFMEKESTRSQLAKEALQRLTPGRA